jgi:acetyltransferase-like isoleucine patch superfamily enzyme
MIIKKTKIPFKAVASTGILPSFFKKLLYRARGYKIGKNVSIGLGSIIIGKNVVIEDGVKIGLASIIRANDITIERFVTIGSFTVIDTGKLKIGEDSRINELVIIGGMKTPQSSLDIGKRTIIMEYSFINTTMPIKIGDDTGIGGHCLLFTHGSWLNQLDVFPVSFAPITLGQKVWLPWRVFIMPGVSLGDNVVVGANSLINKSFESNCLIAGSPAKIIKDNFPSPITEEKVKEIFSGFLSDFLQHLQYYGVEFERIENSERILVNGNYKGKKFSLTINENRFDLPEELRNIDSLIVSNISKENNSLPKNITMNVMYLDVFNKTRIGKSDIGEEFVKFVSRYGLRFSRLD